MLGENNNMKIKRSLFVGMTDYMGASIDDIVSHLIEIRANSKETIETLNEMKEKAHHTALNCYNEIEEFINHRSNQIERYLYDLERLITELPSGVEEKHIEIITEIYKTLSLQDHFCVDFKKEIVEGGRLNDSETIVFVGNIYAKARDQFFDYHDLPNMASRLKTFITKKNKPEYIEAKPGLFGFSVNLKLIAIKVLKKIKKHLTSKST